jgi:hypothetical protein
MHQNQNQLYSTCCNAEPAWKEEHLCHKCGKKAEFYSNNYTTVPREDYIKYVKDTFNGVEFNDDSKFDVDLKYGNIREQLFADIMEGKKLVEVKTEREIWKTTGNIAIEWSSRGELSGIVTTKADWWAHFLAGKEDDDTEALILMTVPYLKRKIKSLKKAGLAHETRGGDDDTSQMVLLPLKHLFNEDIE